MLVEIPIVRQFAARVDCSWCGRSIEYKLTVSLNRGLNMCEDCIKEHSNSGDS
jgi:NMD protein affecting ribosome stability and mRNA decay